MKKYLQKKFINLLAGHLFNIITEKDILEIKPGKVVMYRGRRLDMDTINSLQENAELFSNSVLWEILSNEVKYLSNLRMYERGNTDEDLLAGKCALWVLGVLDKKIKELSNLK